MSSLTLRPPRRGERPPGPEKKRRHRRADTEREDLAARRSASSLKDKTAGRGKPRKCSSSFADRSFPSRRTMLISSCSFSPPVQKLP